MNSNNSTQICRRLALRCNLPQTGFTPLETDRPEAVVAVPSAGRFLTGFTLLEIVIATFILSLTVAGIFSLFSTSYKYIIEAEHRLQAVYYARMVAENLKIYVTEDINTPFPAGADTALSSDNGADKSYTLSGVTISPNNVITNAGAPAPDCAYTIADFTGTTNELKQANITVTWTEP